MIKCKRIDKGHDKNKASKDREQRAKGQTKQKMEPFLKEQKSLPEMLRKATGFCSSRYELCMLDNMHKLVRS